MFRRTIVTALALGAITTVAMARAPGCYPPGIPAPPVRLQTILLLDLTTPRVPRVVESYRRAAMAAASAQGQRLIVLTFAGISPTERLATVFDDVVEAEITDANLVENLPIRAYQRSRACVRTALASWPAKVTMALSDALEGHGAQPFQRSEIVHTLGEALRSFAAPGVTTRLLVYSDGLQHGSGASFYGPDRRPRKIDATQELARVPEGAAAPPALAIGEVQVLWWGLLLGDASVPDKSNGVNRYYDADTIEQLRTFWARLLLGWGVQSVQIERDLLNPRLGPVPRGAQEEPLNRTKLSVVARPGP